MVGDRGPDHDASRTGGRGRGRDGTALIPAADWHRRAVDAANAGDLSRARRWLSRALESDPGPELRAQVEMTLAYVLVETGDRRGALRLCDEAIARPASSTVAVATARSQRGLLMMLLGDADAALRDFAAAVDVAGLTPEVRGRALLNRGGVHLQRGESDLAMLDFAAAIADLRTADLPVQSAKAEHNLGYCRLLRGDLVGALAAMDRARPLLASLGAVNEATCDQDRAEVLVAAGLVSDGCDALAAASAAYGRRGLRRRQGEAELALARALLLADPATSRRWGALARRHFAAADAPAWQSRARGVELAARLRQGGAGRAVRELCHEVVSELDRQGLGWQALALRLHLTRHVGAADPDAVRRSLRGPIDLRLLARLVRGEAAEASGRPAVALRSLRQGLDDLQDWQSSFGSLDLQTGVAGHGVELARAGLRVAVATRRPELLFEWSERARMLASRIQPVQAPSDPLLVADVVELRSLSAAGDAAAAGAPGVRAAELRRRIRERAWRSNDGGVADCCSLAELCAGLDDSTALVAYVATHEQVVALVVTPDSTSRCELGARAELDELLRGLHPDLDVAAEALPEGLGAHVRGHLVQRLTGLAEFLVAPLAHHLGDRGVVLTPSGVLAGVPWTLLPGYQGRCLTVAQSATSWLARGTTPLRTGSVGFVAGPGVRRAAAEVTATAAMWPAARCLTGGDATASAVSELASGVDVLHVAAHGRHSAENPLFSGVELVDGAWHGYDIDQLGAVPDVVLLSACEVGRSSVRWGEELIGMTAAWLYAGARAVIASSAAVADEVAHDVLVEVHRQLVAGSTPAAALAAAVPAATADRPPAPFVCFG